VSLLYARERRAGGTPAPLIVTRGSFLGMLQPLLSMVANLAFSLLAASGGDVSIMSALVTLHGLFPAVAGLWCFHEPRTVLRLCGVGSAAGAIVLMGLSDNSVPTEAAWPWYARGLLFVVAITGWGMADVLSSRVARYVSTRQIMFQVSFAYWVLAALWGWYVVGRGAAPDAFSGWHVLLMVNNFISVAPWFAYVVLGEIADASSFAPFVSTYGAVPVLYAFVVSGEAVTVSKMFGVLGSLAAAFMASSNRLTRCDRGVAAPRAEKGDVAASGGGGGGGAPHGGDGLPGHVAFDDEPEDGVGGGGAAVPRSGSARASRSEI
jgi:drug/metabolite transporter (DMT)-like permease